MFLITDGTTGVPTQAIVVDTEGEIGHAINEIIRLTNCSRYDVVVNPIGEPYIGGSNCPPPGSYAETARLMASIPSGDDFDWDAWKDEMKDLLKP